MAKKITYQEAIEELELLVNQMEKDEVSIDLLSDKVKRAAELIRFCNAKLKKTEEEVETVFKEINEQLNMEED